VDVGVKNLIIKNHSILPEPVGPTIETISLGFSISFVFSFSPSLLYPPIMVREVIRLNHIH